MKFSSPMSKHPICGLYENFMKESRPFIPIFARKRTLIMAKPVKPLLTLDDVQPLDKGSRLDTLRERRRRNMQKEPYDLDLLSECARAWNNLDQFRQERARSLRYLFGNQWGDYVHVHGLGDITEESLIRMQGNIPLKNNVIVSLWMSVFGIHAKQETEPVCYARNQDSKELSDNMSAGLQTNWQNTFMSEKLDTAFAEFLASSSAFARESFEERKEMHDSYTDIENPGYMFWVGGNDPTHQDIRLIGCLHDISREELYFRFARQEYGLSIDRLNEIYHLNTDGQLPSPHTSQPVNDVNKYENLSFYQPSDVGLCRVIEVWREEVKPRYQCFDPLATSQVDKYFRCEKEDLHYVRDMNIKRKQMYDEQGVPEEKRAYITAREIVDKYWQYYFMAPDGRILCEGETPYDYKEHPFTVALFPYINGEIHSFVGFFIDQQRMINRSMMMYDMALKNSAKGMTFLPLSLKPDGMTRDEYAQQKTKFDAVFVYDDTKSRTGARPEFYSHSAANLGQAEMLQIQLNMIHEVSGVSGALQGKTPTSGTSAARYAMESQNATTTIYPLIKKFNGFEERLAQKKCITMQQFYEEGRDITPRKSEKQVFYRANAARNVKFNVSIKNSASSAAFLQLGNEMLDRLLQMQVIDVRTYLKNYDAPFAEKLLQDYDEYVSQIQQGQMPAQPPQVPGADQSQVAAAMEAMRGDGELYSRSSQGAPRTLNNVA